MQKVMRIIQKVSKFQKTTFTKIIADYYQKKGDHAFAGEIASPFDFFFKIGMVVSENWKKSKSGKKFETCSFPKFSIAFIQELKHNH